MLYFTADSDELLPRALLPSLSVFVRQGASEVMHADLWFIDRIGLRQNLSPTRSNGLLAMIKQ